jgi:methyl-accepting chemotaxis protein
MKRATLRKRFLAQVFSLLIIIGLISSTLQIFFMNRQIKSDIYEKSLPIARSVQQGIEETELASKTIEHQIDLKMIAVAKHIGDLLHAQKAESIRNEQLQEMKKNFKLSGLTIFARKGDDIVATKSTDAKDIGFSTKSYGGAVYHAASALLEGKKPSIVPEEGYAEKNKLVLPIVQSGSHKDRPLFFKYVYYHPPGSDYIINPFIEAGEVYKFTQAVGPKQLIDQIEQNSSHVKDISVLNAAVFKNPSLESNFYPPLKKVEYGGFKYKTKKDIAILKRLADHPVKQISVQKVNGEKLYKVFLPINEKRVVYLVLDYQRMTAPFYKYSIILIVSSLLSLLALFLVTVPFFNRIYENIQKIKRQMQLLADGDLTVKSQIKDGSELEILSKSVNQMVHKLNSLVSDTKEQAIKTQRLSVMLEAEASQSVEKMYELSTETTLQSREQLHEIHAFLDEMEKILNKLSHDENAKIILSKMDAMRQLANDRTAVTTEMTIHLSDLLKSLHGQSKELSHIANALLGQMSRFTL